MAVFSTQGIIVIFYSFPSKSAFLEGVGEIPGVYAKVHNNAAQREKRWFCLSAPSPLTLASLGISAEQQRTRSDRGKAASMFGTCSTSDRLRASSISTLPQPDLRPSIEMLIFTRFPGGRCCAAAWTTAKGPRTAHGTPAANCRLRA